jgi:hypothetical protein
MLPPPTTTATWTPSLTASEIALAMCWTTSASMPSGSLPENASPDSFSTTRFQPCEDLDNQLAEDAGDAAAVAPVGVVSCTSAASSLVLPVSSLRCPGSMELPDRTYRSVFGRVSAVGPVPGSRRPDQVCTVSTPRSCPHGRVRG